MGILAYNRVRKHKTTITFTGETSLRSDGLIQYIVYAECTTDGHNMPKERLVQGVASNLETAQAEIQLCLDIANKRAEEINNG